ILARESSAGLIRAGGCSTVSMGRNSASESSGIQDELPPSVTSWLLGLLDTAYGTQAYLKKVFLPCLRHWTDGWGDLTVIEQLYSESRSLLERHARGPQNNAAFVTVQARSERAGGRAVLEGIVWSPLHAFLPEEAVRAPFQAWLPRGEPWAVVVLCGGTADETYLRCSSTALHVCCQRCRFTVQGDGKDSECRRI
ncbi:unnamed protein product, partial [Prorocentrum cordatum]